MKRLVITALLILTCGSTQAQIILDDYTGIPDSLLPNMLVPSDLNIGGSGARAQGMGGAFIGAGDDASALTWNPAGLYSIDKTMMTLGYDRFSSGGSVQSGPLSVAQTGSFSGPGFFSLLSPFRIKNHGFVGGVSYARTTDEASNFAFDYSILVDIREFLPTYPVTTQYVSRRSTYHAQITPVTVGFGTRLSERVAAGMSINIITGNSVTVFSEHVKSDSAFVAEYYPQPANFDYDLRIIDTSKFSGMFFSFGFKYIQPKLSLGVVLKLPYSLRQETDRTIREVTTVNGLQREQGSLTRFKDGNVTDIEMPLMVGFGGSYKTNSSTTFAADVEYRPFSGKRLKIREELRLVPGGKDEEIFHYQDMHWRNVLILRGGGEKLLTTGSAIFPVVPLRLGLSLIPVPSPNKSGGVASGTASGINLSVGSGVQWTQAKIDVAYTYRSLKQTFDSYETHGKSHFMYVTFTGYF